ncbi:lysozyme C-like [Eriocheir sinensis]|uniref:lysozyme C-like n=1 Tax=Eriocheir sinensis TaxID=95602 RepID=UPI0021C69C5D|nr:lysozyme C-like [Eriocheir sinensis]WRK13804.1 C-type lysozyme [Eriocheir sinensis]
MRLAVMLMAVVVVAVVGVAQGKIFSKCELAKELETIHHIKRDDVKNWVCIAQYESTFNTAAINHANWDGSKDYGLFQLNNKYWCGDESGGKNVCGIPCSALLDSDLTDDLRCIKKIIRDTERWKGKGTALTAWVAYVNKCQNRNLDEYMSECWKTDTASNTIWVKDESSINALPNTENAPSAGEHWPIINNARVPNKVISNMHPVYRYQPVYPSSFRTRSYPFYFH